jgi:hypothetical protein
MTIIDLLYCIGCESETGDEHMDMLLELAGISRAELDAHTISDKNAERRAAMDDPLIEGVPT